MIKLRILKITNNKISDISSVFSNITSLQVLDLENNEISILTGSEFENLTSLLELNLAMNRIQEPIMQIMPDNKLRNLYLHSNNIKAINSDLFKTLHNLETLDLSFNHIDNIHYKNFQSLYGLRILNMSSNILTTIYTGAFTGLPQLELLNVSNNRISEIFITGVFSLHSMHSLDISHNLLHDLDYVGLISRLPRLTYLKMDNNLLPCDLENEMEAYFEEDNFKFVFYESRVGSIKCIDAPVKRQKEVSESFVQEEPSSHNIGGLEITMIVLICLIIISIGYLYYLQYRAHQNLNISSSNRALSSVHLVPSEVDNTGGDDFV